MAKKDKKEAPEVTETEIVPEEDKGPEIIEVDCGILFPDYKGARITSRKYAKVSEEKTLCFAMSVQAPQDLAVWEELTGRPVIDTAKKTALTILHGEVWFDKVKVDIISGAIDGESEAFIASFTTEMAEAIQYKERKASKAKQDSAELVERKAKDVKLKADLGLEPDCTQEEFDTALAAAVAKMRG